MLALVVRNSTHQVLCRLNVRPAHSNRFIRDFVNLRYRFVSNGHVSTITQAISKSCKRTLQTLSLWEYDGN